MLFTIYYLLLQIYNRSYDLSKKKKKGVHATVEVSRNWVVLEVFIYTIISFRCCPYALNIILQLIHSAMTAMIIINSP